MKDLLKKAFGWGPVFFGVGFVAPLIAQSLDAGGVSALVGLSTIQFGLLIGVGLGVAAKTRGRWV